MMKHRAVFALFLLAALLFCGCAPDRRSRTSQSSGSGTVPSGVTPNEKPRIADPFDDLDEMIPDIGTDTDDGRTDGNAPNGNTDENPDKR